MTKIGQIRPRRVVAWVAPEGQLIGLVGALEAFDAANRVLAHAGKAPLYRLDVIGADARIATASGLAVEVRPPRSVRKLDTLVVGGALESRPVADDPRCKDLRRLASSARRVVSICAGAFWLGAIGLLENRRCTTHWLVADELAARFRGARVRRDELYTEDGNVYTSAGATAGVDLALYLIRKDGGRRLSLAVARALVVFVQRPGGQSQFSAATRAPLGVDDRIRAVLDRVVRRPADDHCVDALARRAGMSPRHFTRVFRDQTGRTPAAFVVHARVEAAKRLLLEGDQGIEWIADRSGFGSVESFRRAFSRACGVAPSQYRRRFGSG